MRSIVIVGLKHCGKSSVGRLLAQNLQRPYYDADHLLEDHYFTQNRQRLDCREIYGRLGKENFDKLQVYVLQKFFEHCRWDLSLLSLGGGAGDLDEIGTLLKKEACFVVLLEEELALLFERVACGGLPPFLQNVQDPKATFAKFCEPRLQRYRAWADMIVPCIQRSQQELAAELCRIF